MRPSVMDAMRQRLIEAMEKRADGHEGDVRRIVAEKRVRLVDAWAGNAGNKETGTVGSEGEASPRGELGALIDRFAAVDVARHNGGGAGDVSSGRHAFPELPALEAFRKIWSGLRTESQLRQTLEYVPENAGPLNSSALVHRSIELMRELSPGYLRHFLTYLDDLAWIERTTTTGALTEKGAAQPASIGKRPKAKPRARR